MTSLGSCLSNTEVSELYPAKKKCEEMDRGVQTTRGSTGVEVESGRGVQRFRTSSLREGFRGLETDGPYGTQDLRLGGP